MLVGAAACMAWAAAFLPAASAASSREQADTATSDPGGALFDGRLPLRGRIATHPSDLPPDVIRCANCHAAGRGPAVRRTIAPRLDADLLRQFRERRGGPASRYDAATFCRLLREGVDPTDILISYEMPRFDLDNAQCQALWRFVAEST